MIVRDGRRVEHNLGPRQVSGSEVAWNIAPHGQRGRDGNTHSNGGNWNDNPRNTLRQPTREIAVLTEMVEL